MQNSVIKSLFWRFYTFTFLKKIEPCPNTFVWFNFWIGPKHFWTYRRMGHVCAVCHNRAKCFHENWSRIWISLKVNKSNIGFVSVSSPQTQPKFLRYSFRYNFVMMSRQKKYGFRFIYLYTDYFTRYFCIV